MNWKLIFFDYDRCGNGTALLIKALFGKHLNSVFLVEFELSLTAVKFNQEEG